MQCARVSWPNRKMTAGVDDDDDDDDGYARDGQTWPGRRLLVAKRFTRRPRRGDTKDRETRSV